MNAANAALAEKVAGLQGNAQPHSEALREMKQVLYGIQSALVNGYGTMETDDVDSVKGGVSNRVSATPPPGALVNKRKPIGEDLGGPVSAVDRVDGMAHVQRDN